MPVSRQRIFPLQAGEPGKVRIRGLQNQSALNRQCRQMGVDGQVARRAGLFDQIRQEREMAVGRMDDFDMRLFQP